MVVTAAIRVGGAVGRIDRAGASLAELIDGHAVELVAVGIGLAGVAAAELQPAAAPLLVGVVAHLTEGSTVVERQALAVDAGLLRTDLAIGAVAVDGALGFGVVVGLDVRVRRGDVGVGGGCEVVLARRGDVHARDQRQGQGEDGDQDEAVHVDLLSSRYSKYCFRTRNSFSGFHSACSA